ncbi:Putative cytoplasmic protein USSDB7A [Salmonella enterica subsp. arizonae]|uniref:Cytoplasmic protein USSDB7A n=1 Tax=Salmonella enterica subsp. arizonae TaxID=59203 RepID=A0A379TGH1_SALER|nr:Putative cytoplasmic protein USSDB7A [Salmonella enterica subsp. arizonae]
MDAIYLKLDGIEGESLTKGFEKTNKTYCLQPQPGEVGIRRSERNIYWWIDADEAYRSCDARAL